MNGTGDNMPDTTGKLEIVQVVIDLKTGLFAFTYADGITEHMKIRDSTELPTVFNFLTALTDEVATYGRPQRRPQQPAPADTTPSD